MALTWRSPAGPLNVSSSLWKRSLPVERHGETRGRWKTPRAPERRGGSGEPNSRYIASESFEKWNNATRGKLLRQLTYRATEYSGGRRLRRIAAPPSQLCFFARRGHLIQRRVMAVARRAPRPSYGLIRQHGVAIRIDSWRKLGRDARKRPREQRPRPSVKYRCAGGTAFGPTETLEGGARRAGNSGRWVTPRRDHHTTSVATLGRRRKASKGRTRSTSAA